MKLYSKLRVGCAAFLALSGALLGLFAESSPLELKSLDMQFRILRAYAPKAAKVDVVVVGIDEATTNALYEPIALWHSHLGQFLHAASSAGASVIGLDIILPGRSFDSILPGNDRHLLSGIISARRNSNIVLARTVEPSGDTRNILPAFAGAAGDDALGYALLPIDFDGAVRRFDERIELHGNNVPTLAGQMARKLGRSVQGGFIDYSVGSKLDFIPLQAALSWARSDSVALLEEAFRGKAVLLGSVLKYEDRYPAAVDLVGWDPHATNVPGVLLHAQVLRNLLNDGVLSPASNWIPVLLGLLAGLLSAWGPRIATASIAIVVLALSLSAVSLLALQIGIFLPVAQVILVAMTAVASRQILEISFNLLERRRLRHAFGGYVSPPVMDEILSGVLTPTLGGERRFTCVLFSDIRGYTRRSENVSPEQTIAFLNRYFERMVPIIHGCGGTVISFMGDGIMATFGAPNTLPNPCEAAFSASQRMLLECELLNDEIRDSGQEVLQIGIGLHAGEGIAGHVGASMRHEYSVIGDVTNVASRLEGLTKETGYSLICSHAVVSSLRFPQSLVELGRREIKGHSPVEIYGFDPTVAINESP